MSTHQSRRDGSRKREPPSATVEFLAWLFSVRLWLQTAVLVGAVAVSIGAIAWARYGMAFTDIVIETLTTPYAALAVFLAGRGAASLYSQWRRDRRMRRKETQLSSNVSTAALVTVASFSVVGLIAAGVALPIIYELSGSFFYLAAGIAVVSVPISYLLLVYQLHELIGADRYRRGFRVIPAAWFFLVSLPWIVTVWMLLTDVSLVRIPIPVEVTATVPTSREYAPLDVWGAIYAGLIAPTLLAYVYAVRRQVEVTLRALF